MSKKIPLIIFLLRVNLPVVLAARLLSAEQGELPEYTEYLRQKQAVAAEGASAALTTAAPAPATTTTMSKSETAHQYQSEQLTGQLMPLSSSIPFPFTLIQFCNEAPPSGNYYRIVFCWGAMLILYSLAIAALIAYISHTLFWFKLKVRQEANGKKQQQQQQESSPEPIAGFTPLNLLSYNNGK